MFPVSCIPKSSGVPLLAPVNSVVPVITGTAEVGEVLSASTGTWSGVPTAYAYQWQRNDGGGWASIGGATNSTYEVVEADEECTLRVRVIASNAAGAGAEAFSEATEEVPVVYVRTAFVSSTGNDGSAALNDLALPYASFGAAIADLDAAHPADPITVRLLDEVTDDVTIAPARCTVGVTFLGHGGLRQLIGTVTTTGANGEPQPSPNDPAEPGVNGENGGSITLDAVTLDAFVGTGGDGSQGGDFLLDDGDGGAGGDGGDGGNVTLLNSATVTSFTSNGGLGGAGGAPGANSGSTGATGADGDPGQQL